MSFCEITKIRAGQLRTGQKIRRSRPRLLSCMREKENPGNCSSKSRPRGPIRRREPNLALGLRGGHSGNATHSIALKRPRSVGADSCFQFSSCSSRASDGPVPRLGKQTP
jgi:hypothetical protein